MTLDEALAELERTAGNQFDPAVVDSLLRLARDGQLRKERRPAGTRRRHEISIQAGRESRSRPNHH